MIIKDIVAWFDKYGPRGPEETLLFGDSCREVKGIAVCWMPTLEVINKAADEGCNLIICHENLTFPYNFYSFGQHLETTLTWKANRERLALLTQKDIAVFRAHAILDRAYIADCFIEAIGLDSMESQNTIAKTAVIADTTLEKLALQIKDKLKLACIRMTGDPEKNVRKAGVAIGGLGLSVNMGFLQKLVEESVDVIITGEADEEALRFAEDSGIAMIETSHIVCENIGLARFAEDLKGELSNLKVVMLDGSIPWCYM